MDLPIKSGDFAYTYVSLPEGINLHYTQGIPPAAGMSHEPPMVGFHDGD